MKKTFFFFLVILLCFPKSSLINAGSGSEIEDFEDDVYIPHLQHVEGNGFRDYKQYYTGSYSWRTRYSNYDLWDISDEKVQLYTKVELYIRYGNPNAKLQLLDEELNILDEIVIGTPPTSWTKKVLEAEEGARYYKAICPSGANSGLWQDNINITYLEADIFVTTKYTNYGKFLIDGTVMKNNTEYPYVGGNTLRLIGASDSSKCWERFKINSTEYFTNNYNYTLTTDNVTIWCYFSEPSEPSNSLSVAISIIIAIVISLFLYILLSERR